MGLHTKRFVGSAIKRKNHGWMDDNKGGERGELGGGGAGLIEEVGKDIQGTGMVWVVVVVVVVVVLKGHHRCREVMAEIGPIFHFYY